MKFSSSRRQFLRGLAGASLAGTGGCFSIGGDSRKIRLAVVGCWGKGYTDWKTMYKSGLVEIVAFCDADATIRDTLAIAIRDSKLVGLDMAKIPFYTDYRRLLDDAGVLGIEAMTVSTPDHTHAPIAIRAMQQGIHVYVQKPLVRTLWELDYFKKTAKEHGVITQMGNQGSALDTMRRCTEVLQSGILGDVTEVHVWTNRPVWPQGKIAAAAALGPVSAKPSTLDWDAWLGPAKKIDYRGAYPEGTPLTRYSKNVFHAFNWRGFFDFGCGAFGDMACHTMNLAFRGLELGGVSGAERVMVEDATDLAYPMKSIVKMHYLPRRSVCQPGKTLPAVELYWYDGAQQPKAELMPKVVATLGAVPKTGCYIKGSKGEVSMCDDYGGKCLIALDDEPKMVDMFGHEASKAVARVIPFRLDAANSVDKGPGAAAVSADGHYVEFLQAIRGEGPVFADTHSRCYSDVDYSVPIMEGILVGCVAQRLGGSVTWDATARRFVGNDEANALVRPYVRREFAF